MSIKRNNDTYKLALVKQFHRNSCTEIDFNKCCLRFFEN